MEDLTEKQQAKEIFDLHLKSLIKNIEINQMVNYKLLAKNQTIITIGLIIETERFVGIVRYSSTILPQEPQAATSGGLLGLDVIPKPRLFWEGVLKEAELL